MPSKKKDEIDENQLVLESLNFTETPPQYLYKTQDKISNMLIHGIYNNGEHLIRIGEDQENHEILTRIQISYENIFDSLPAAQSRFDSFDRAVLDSLLTLYLHRKGQIFTLSQLYRVMTGKQTSSGISTKQKEEIKKSLNKIFFSSLELDLSAESQIYDFRLDDKPVTELKMKGPLFPGEILTVKVAGRETVGIRVLSVPILYRYALPKRQLIEYSSILLNGRTGNISKQDICIHDYMIRYVGMLFRTHGKINNGLLFSTIYEIAGIDEEGVPESTAKKQRAKARKEIEGILDYWKSINHILSYKIICQKRTPYKLIIEINPRSPFSPTAYDPTKKQLEQPPI